MFLYILYNKIWYEKYYFMCALMFYIFDNTGFNIVMKIMTVQRVSIKWYCIYL